MDDSNLKYLAELYGIEPCYSDPTGRVHQADSETLRRLLAAMGISARSWEECEERIFECLFRRASRGIPPTLTYFTDHECLAASMTIAAGDPWTRLEWEIVEEDGVTTHSGFFNRPHLPVQERFQIYQTFWERYELFFPVRLPLGYHTLRIAGWEGAPADGRISRIIIAPQHCYLDPSLDEGWRGWGIRTLLYSLRSKESWGIGDFGVLQMMIDAAAELGAGTLAIGALHALDPRDVRGQNPYFPTSRCAINPLFIDVTAVPEAEQSAEFAAFKATESFQRKRNALSDSDFIDYRSVLHMKLSALQLLFQNFRTLSGGDPRAQAFQTFIGSRPDIHSFAIFETLREYFEQLQVIGWGWRHWPEEYRSPESLAVRSFAEKHAERVQFHEYVQFVADQQLQAACERGGRAGLRLGLCADLAPNTRISSAESWSNQEVLAQGALLGRPPGTGNPDGLNLRLCCWIPEQLQLSFFAPFIQVVRQNMRFAGALRLGMLEQLKRQYWIPEGMRPSQGAFVRNPFRDMFAILALESHRNKCVVIGHDCDPQGMPPELVESGVLFQRVHLIDRRGVDFLQSWEYPRAAVAIASTHDSPTLTGFWTGADIAAKQDAGLTNPYESQEEYARRDQEREVLVESLQKEGVLPNRKKNLQARDVNLGVHRLLARSPALLHLVSLEDLIEQEAQAYIAGTFEERPNWCIRSTMLTEEISSAPLAKTIAAAVRNEGRR